MRLWTLSALLASGLVFTCIRVASAASTSSLPVRPELASPYQLYELELSPFSPAPNQPAGVLLHVSINGGRPLRMVLDSGAGFVVVSAKVGRALGLSSGSEMDLVGLGTRPAKMGIAEKVEVGNVSFRNCRVAMVQGKVIEGADGVIPLAMFSDFLIRLDLPGRTLALIPYAGEPRPEVLFPPGGRRNRLPACGSIVEPDLPRVCGPGYGGLLQWGLARDGRRPQQLPAAW